MASLGNFHDALAVERPPNLQADVCIVGAGASGITLARKICQAHSMRVLLLESGSGEFNARTQSLYDGMNVGVEYLSLMACRLRFFGGTTNHWAGFCTPNTERDFKSVDGVPLTGWPLRFDEVAPYLRRAEDDLGFKREMCDPATRLAKEGFTFSENDSEQLKTTLFTILEEPRARHYVLACHAIENARLLLASNDVLSKGIGNEHDMVGRCFMDHPSIHAGLLLVHNPDVMPLYLATAQAWPRKFSACLTLPESVTNQSRCLQYYCRLQPYVPSQEEGTWGAMKRLYQKKNQPFEMSMLDDLARVLRDLSGTYEIVHDRLTFGSPDRFLLDQRIEQSPNLASRVFLSDERDELGSRRAHLDWQLNDVDLRTFNTGQDALAQHFGALNLGRVEAAEWTRAAMEAQVKGNNHHMGTTRMSVSPRDGVVDRNCRVHGVANLYVAGSSIFSRGMFSGPTMALLGFAHRLADHIIALER